MRFKHGVIGPDFNKADIVAFDFGEAEISLVLPKKPDSNLGFIAQQDQKVLSDEPSDNWMMHPFGFRIFDLVRTSWSYIDEASENTLAIENFYLNLIEVPEAMRDEINPLSKTGFLDWVFDFFKRISVRGDASLFGTEAQLKEMKAHRMPLSLQDIELYSAGTLDWPMMTILMPDCDDDEDTEDVEGPGYFIYIPLSERFFLYIDHSISMISSASTPITLPKADILELKRAILMEILAHIKVTYSPEILALIEAKNKAE